MSENRFVLLITSFHNGNNTGIQTAKTLIELYTAIIENAVTVQCVQLFLEPLQPRNCKDTPDFPPSDFWDLLD